MNLTISAVSKKYKRGGLGNVVFFFLWMFTVTGELFQAVDVIGIDIPLRDMQVECQAAYPDYGAGERQFSMGFNFKEGGEVWDLKTFEWSGMDWTPAIVFARIKWFAFASLREIFLHFRFTGLLMAELKLMLKGVSRWWFIVALGLIIVGLSIPLEPARQWVLPFAWIWPLLLWSKMGTREVRHATQQMIFSAAHSLSRQLPAAWLAGVALAMLLGGGVGLRLILSGDWQSVLAWTTGALFIPTLALAFGVWSGSSKLFEVTYMLLWYIGPINKMPALDFTRSNDPVASFSYLMITAALFIAAVIGRRRQQWIWKFASSIALKIDLDFLENFVLIFMRPSSIISIVMSSVPNFWTSIWRGGERHIWRLCWPNVQCS